MEGGVEEVHEEGEGLPVIGAGAATCPLPLLVGVAGSPPPAAPRSKCIKFAPAKKILAPSLPPVDTHPTKDNDDSAKRCLDSFINKVTRKRDSTDLWASKAASC